MGIDMLIKLDMLEKLNDKNGNHLIMHELQQHAKAGYWIYDYIEKILTIDNKFMSMSEFSEKSTQFSLDEFRSLVHPDDWNLLKRFVNKVKISLDNKIMFRILLPSGYMKWYEVQLFRDEVNSIPIIWGTVIDNTVIKKAQSHQKKTLQAVKKYKKDHETIADKMSKDIKNDVDKILALCQSIKKSVLAVDCDEDEVMCSIFNDIGEITTISSKWGDASDKGMLAIQTYDKEVKKTNVLVVYNADYNEREFWSQMTKHRSIDITLVTDFDAAMQKITSEQFDVVAINAHLKKASGIQLLSYMRRKDDVYRDISVIVYSNRVDDEIKRSFFKAGADYFVHDLLLKVVFEKIIYDDIFYEECSNDDDFTNIYKYIDFKSVKFIGLTMERSELYDSCLSLSKRSREYINLVRQALSTNNHTQLLELFKDISVDVKVFGVYGLSDSVSMIIDALTNDETVGLNLVIEDFLKEYDVFIEELDIVSESLKYRGGK